ncbi:MAG TPA: adenylate/guanylate cyclase domain-containing protein [Candidatus Acidoferrales bacterium]|nr:adenylate/guanylate cyclase domain-containing protein [Candidatus Acidoferrales bacterium]
MQSKRFKRAPVILAGIVLALVCGLRVWNPDLLERAECMTYDLRVRHAQHFPAPAATNLAFVAMDDSSIAAIRHKLLGLPYGLYWPRHVYGRVVEELSVQGAKSIAFDVLFGELRPDHAAVQMAGGGMMESDDFFALQTHQASNVIAAFTVDVTPPDLFATNSLALGDISTEKDSDGVLRRIKSFNLKWHPAFKSAARQMDINLGDARILPDKIILPLPNGTNYPVALDRDGNFDLTDFVGDEIPKNMKRFDKPYERIWDLGIVMAAQELNLDLAHAEVDLPRGKIAFRGTSGVERTIPVDRDGFFYINWQLTATDARVTRASIEDVLKQDKLRLKGGTNLPAPFQGKLVVIGSAAQGNDLSDHGATPLENDTLLVSKHWNVANSVIKGQFIWRAPLWLEIALILVLGVFTAVITWRLRAVAASVAVVLLMAVYFGGAFFVFTHFRWWLPMVYPLGGAMLALHGILLVHLVVFEEHAKRRVKSVFSKMISPEIVNELLRVEEFKIGGAHREVTVFFADVRGFTTLTDQMQESVAEFVRKNQVEFSVAEKYFEESARETLEIVNVYLSAVAEAVKDNGGTLDKYIGDCVMAFWNAPTPNEKHAVAAVRAAIDAQRAIHELNVKREADNSAREIDSRARVAAGLPPKLLNVSLQLGTGINTGLVTVGLMGSDAHGFNYTVFGREVNLASRLEGVSGSGRIIISDLTYFQLLRHAPELAATCVELFPVTVKGLKDAVRIYEVPWQENK